ncbi:hypothetical protein CALK_2446 [Chitinivibrio alkaliphilus ACht1]|uniref:Na+-translocating membrane potential-generating system MpsC domain-containing protein n=2 Tax=Chitinivibrio TaxID=1505231 RepID=U7D8H3_9BACT|nr:hypothetical protein CALK_2446 [Chitinivibrio alkaliphilus ACht1]
MKNSIPRGEAEHQISQAIIRFEQEYMGRGPEEVRTVIFDDIIFVRLKGVLTPAEKQLANTEDNQKGRSLIKQVRQELLEKARPLLERIIIDITGCEIVSLHTDISIATGERVIIFTLVRALKFNA